MSSLCESKMSLACESEARILNENALRFSIFSKPPPIVEYIKTISSLIGASHVLAVFEEADSIKVFFDDRRFVDNLLKTGIHVLGHHIRAEYVVPPGTKVVLSNVDPVLSNYDVMRLLSHYGSIVSPVVRPPVCDEVEFCHINFGVRYVYMALDRDLPTRLDIKYGDQLACIKIRADESSTFPAIKLDRSESSDEETNNINFVDEPRLGPPSLADPDAVQDNSDIPVLVSVHSEVINTEEQITYHQSPVIETKPGKRRRHHQKSVLLKPKITSAAKAAKKISQKHKWNARKVKVQFKRGRGRGRRGGRGRPRAVVMAPVTEESSSDAGEASTPPLLESNSDYSNPGGRALDDENIISLIDNTKFSRCPMDHLKKFLGEECNNVMLYHLIDRIQSYGKKHHDQAYRLRVKRLTETLKNAMEN